MQWWLTAADCIRTRSSGQKLWSPGMAVSITGAAVLQLPLFSGVHRGFLIFAQYNITNHHFRIVVHRLQILATHERSIYLFSFSALSIQIFAAIGTWIRTLFDKSMVTVHENYVANLLCISVSRKRVLHPLSFPSLARQWCSKFRAEEDTSDKCIAIPSLAGQGPGVRSFDCLVRYLGSCSLKSIMNDVQSTFWESVLQMCASCPVNIC